MKRISFFWKVFIILSITSAGPIARGEQKTVTFDDLPTPVTTAYGPYGVVTNRYAGLNWQNFEVENGTASTNSGYKAGVVSANNVALNVSGGEAIISSTNSSNPFNFVSANLTAAWNDNLKVVTLGYYNGTKVYGVTNTLSATTPKLINFNFKEVTEVIFTCSGGTLHSGYFHAEPAEEFALDNLVYEPTNLPPAATPTFSPAPGTNTNSVAVKISTTTKGATIHYTLDGTVPALTSAVYTTPLTLTGTTTLAARVFANAMSPSPVTNGAYAIQCHVVLLLHGMNSSPTTWNDFMADHSYFSYLPVIGSTPLAPIIYAGTISGANTSTPDIKKVLYYRVQFGAFDKLDGVQGLEGITSTSLNGTGGPLEPSVGDFTPFSGNNSLATEVNDAVLAILKLHPSAQIVLVGHSRGGIAAREFMENTGYATAQKAVVGLLTVGTPHQGTPFGGLYTFLTGNPRAAKPPVADWTLVDRLRDYHLPTGAGALVGFQIDFRRPTINWMGTGSAQISALNAGGSSLPATAVYGTLVFDGAPLGLLSTHPYNVFTGLTLPLIGTVYPALTAAASNAVCGSTPIAQFHGDGIVPADSQTFSLATQFQNTTGVLHTAEPPQKLSIRNALNVLVNWWNP